MSDPLNGVPATVPVPVPAPVAAPRVQIPTGPMPAQPSMFVPPQPIVAVIAGAAAAPSLSTPTNVPDPITTWLARMPPEDAAVFRARLETAGPTGAVALIGEAMQALQEKTAADARAKAALDAAVIAAQQPAPAPVPAPAAVVPAFTAPPAAVPVAPAAAPVPAAPVAAPLVPPVRIGAQPFPDSFAGLNWSGDRLAKAMAQKFGAPFKILITGEVTESGVQWIAKGDVPEGETDEVAGDPNQLGDVVRGVIDMIINHREQARA